jgi:glutathionylspermidine synthase
MELKEAIQVYHDLLTPELAQESQEQLEQQLRRQGLYFGSRPLCTVLRPRFLTYAQYRYLQTSIQPLLGALDKAYRAAIEDEGIREQFGLFDWEEQLLQTDPGFTSPTPVSRLDAFYVTDDNTLRFTEYNAEVPAASAYNDVLSEVFFGLPITREFMHHYELRSLPTRYRVMHALLDAHRQWAGRRTEPRVAILDWDDVPTYSEFRLFLDYFRNQGLECIITTPAAVEYRNGGLYAGDFHITLIYKRVLITELVEKGGLNHPVIEAVKDGAVCMVNPFHCKLLYKKASLAVLSDERNAHLFTSQEREAIAAHIPWTRRVRARHTVYDGEKVDLLPLIIEKQERMVLKPNDDYGGHGIVLGWLVDTSTWEAAVQKATESVYVVQERVVIPREPYPSYSNGELQIYERMLDTAPFIFYGEYVDGCLTRLGTDPLLNVTAGGGSSVPTFVVARR